jgi:hypothetical protein
MSADEPPRAPAEPAPIAPRNPEADERRKRFNELNQFVQSHGGAWLTSVPGSHEVTFDALVGSPLPEQLAALGYDVVKTGTSERILPHAVARRFETSSSGARAPVTEGSTKPVSVQVTNAGTTTVEQYDLRMP